VVNLISHAGTQKRLCIQAEIDESSYPIGKTVLDEEMAKLRITRDAFHGEWNYSFSPS
jgi:hypothetical protein